MTKAKQAYQKCFMQFAEIKHDQKAAKSQCKKLWDAASEAKKAYDQAKQKAKANTSLQWKVDDGSKYGDGSCGIDCFGWWETMYQEKPGDCRKKLMSKFPGRTGYAFVQHGKVCFYGKVPSARGCTGD